MNKVTTDFSVHIYETGEANHPTLVCFHGLTSSSESFLELADYLKNYHLVAFDSPGHGKTPPLAHEEDYLFSNLANWFDKAMGQNVNPPFFIIGHSWGAIIALFYAKQFPEKVRGVILLDGGYMGPADRPNSTLEGLLKFWENMYETTRYKTMDDVFVELKKNAVRWNEKIEQMVESAMKKSEDGYTIIPSLFTIQSIIKSFFNEPFREIYENIKTPVLLLHSTLPKEMEETRFHFIHQMKAKIKQLTIIGIPNAGHSVHWDAPEKIAYEIDKWIVRNSLKNKSMI
jgi:pimeloyl-ACP methyl ester carboxylesterase